MAFLLRIFPSGCLRQPLRGSLLLWAGLCFGIAFAVAEEPAAAAPTVEEWGIFQIDLKGSATGNPFIDVSLSAIFTQGETAREATGFYDGAGCYRLRFMPEKVGEWHYVTRSNRPELDGKTGTMSVVSPRNRNHGPVRVEGTFHFAYADGTPFRPVGTTCYAWIHQEEWIQEKTLQTLATAPFNKLRMCVFPKHYEWNSNEPLLYPFEGTPPAGWDLTRFNPAFFRHLEKRVEELRDRGIEADIILFHPYDKGHWGFDRMDAASDDRYLRYIIARLAAFRNVWWSLANEYDFMKEKKTSDWDRLFQIVQAGDPYAHLRSIHNGSQLYDHNKPWVTHVSIQNGSAVEDSGRAVLYRDVYRKPIVFDEVKYEGDLPQRWGNLSAEEMVLRCWEGLVAGTYVGHSECYLDPQEVIWWAKGGVLHGQSPARLAFMRRVMEEGPAPGIDPIDKWQDDPFAGVPGKYYLGYFGKEPLLQWKFSLYKTGVTEGMKFSVEVIDTWNMTITQVNEVFVAKKKDNYTFEDKEGRLIALPGRAFIALRIRAIE